MSSGRSAGFGYPPGSSDHPTHESLRQEFETVCARHAELFQDLPEYSIAVLLHEIDELLAKHNVDIEVAAEAASVIGLNLGDREAGALLGACRDTDRVQRFIDSTDAPLAMFDDRQMEGHLLQPGGER